MLYVRASIMRKSRQDCPDKAICDRRPGLRPGRRVEGGAIVTNVLLEKKGNIAVATINRPKALNALNSQVLEDLNELVELVKADEEIRALVLTGCGEKAFVAAPTSAR